MVICLAGAGIEGLRATSREAAAHVDDAHHVAGITTLLGRTFGCAREGSHTVETMQAVDEQQVRSLRGGATATRRVPGGGGGEVVIAVMAAGRGRREGGDGW